MAKYLSPTLLLSYLGQNLGLSADLLGHVICQLPATWRQYYWVRELVRTNRLAMLTVKQTGGFHIIEGDDPNAPTRHYCEVTWGNSNNVEFDWKTIDSPTLGWNFSVANSGEYWHQIEGMSEDLWRKRISMIAQIGGLCSRLAEETKITGSRVKWTGIRYSNQCRKLKYEFIEHQPPPRCGVVYHFCSIRINNGAEPEYTLSMHSSPGALYPTTVVSNSVRSNLTPSEALSTVIAIEQKSVRAFRGLPPPPPRAHRS